MNISTRTSALVSVAALTLALAACSPSNEDPNFSPNSGSTSEPTGAPAELSGTLNGAGASSQESATEAWRAGFQAKHPGVTVNYDPVGSGGGRTQFLDGAISFAGSDALMKPEEYEASFERCDGDGGAIHLPLYVSPIAVVANLPGIDLINMDANTIANVFLGNITTWNDPVLVEQNPGLDLPASPITIVHRADDSGTTQNFSDYLYQASDVWTAEPSGAWLGAAGESGPGTSAVIQIVQDTQGAIGYVDASRAGNLATVALRVGEEWVPFSAEAAAAVVDASPLAEGANGENDLAYQLDRTTTASGVYPLVLVTYSILCQQYEDANERALVTEYLKYVASAEGQAQSASAAGSSPISAQLSSRVTEILNQVAAN